MKREWRPGDDIGPIVIDWNGTAVATLLRTLEKHYEPGHRALWSAIHRANAPSPLVVIDPEDREQVERFSRTYAAAGHLIDPTSEARTDAMQAALREFANPTPPKPDEPMGLGAVVEDESGVWVRAESGDGGWCPSGIPGSVRYRCWADFPSAVRVLSEGMTP